MYIGGTWLFGKPDVFIQDDVLYRRVYETEQVYRNEKIITKEEFIKCFDEWIRKEGRLCSHE